MVLELDFTSFPIIETERLILRRIGMDDANDLFLLRSNEEAVKYLDRPMHSSINETRELIKKIEDNIQQNKAIAWGISLKSKIQLIGTIGYHRIENEHYRAEIGYMIHPDYWRTGLTSEAIKPVINFGFNQMNLHSIEANVNPGNIASIKLLEKHKFTKEAHFKENYFYNGKFLDSAIYSRVKMNIIK